MLFSFKSSLYLLENTVSSDAGCFLGFFAGAGFAYISFMYVASSHSLSTGFLKNILFSKVAESKYKLSIVQMLENQLNTPILENVTPQGY